MSTRTRPTLSPLSCRHAARVLSGVLVAGWLSLTACDRTDRWPAAPRAGDARLQRLRNGAAAPAVDDTASGAGEATQTATDPSGDTIGSVGVPLDLTALTVARDTDSIVLTLDFAQDLPVPVVGWAPTITGLVELDLDEDPATGHGASMDILHRFLADGGSADLGVDAAVGLAPLDADSTAPVYDAAGAVVGRVKPEFAGRRVNIRVPRALLAHDAGHLGATVLIGNGLDVTDFAPSDGHFTFGDARGGTGWPAARLDARAPR